MNDGPGGPELDLRRALSGVQELVVLSMLMFDRHQVDQVLAVLASSVQSVTRCQLVQVQFQREGRWISWPRARAGAPAHAPVGRPRVESIGDQWRCTAAIAGLSGAPGQLVLTSPIEPDTEQLFVIQRLGHLLGAALVDAELHERDHRRARELDQMNVELARTVASLRQREAVQDVFTKLAAAGSDEADLAASLSRLTGRTVVVRDGFGHETTRVTGPDPVLGPHPADPPSAPSSELFRRNGSVVATVGGSADLGTIALEIPPGDDDEDSRFALRYAGTALGLLKAHEQAMGEVENRLSRDLLEDLLEGVAPETARARAMAQGHDLRVPQDVVVVRWPTWDQPSASGRDRGIQRVREAMVHQQRACLAARRQGLIVVLAEHAVDIHRLYEDLARASDSPDGQVAVGEPATSPQLIPRAFGQARRALTVRQRSNRPHGATAYADLGVARLLAGEENLDEVERLITDWLADLLEYDRAHDTDLVPTLAAYLDQGGKYDETAKSLSIHRNTLRYRLTRIADISGHDVTDVETRLNVHLATRAWRMRNEPSPAERER